MEVFNATCGSDQVVMMESARYGRMNIGRCMKAGYGHQGCSVDVLSFLDSKCSGRRSCRFQVPDVSLYEMQPCPPDFTSYLEATHYCISVTLGDPFSCENKGHNKIKDVQFGFITSHSLTMTTMTSRKLQVGSSSCPWMVEVMPGQRINVSLHSILLYSYKVSQSGSSISEEACFEVGLVDDGERNVVSVCNDERIMHILISRSHFIHIQFANLEALADIGIFIFEFRATGCPNIIPSANSWHQKNGETLVARCNNSIQSWHLICRGTEWIGETGNCSNIYASEKFKSWSLEQIFNVEDSFPFGVLLAVSIGVAMGIVIGASLLCLITIYLKRQKHNSLATDGYIPPKDQAEGSPSPVQLSGIRECQLPNHWSFNDSRNSKQAYASPTFLGETLVNVGGVEVFIGDVHPSLNHPSTDQCPPIRHIPSKDSHIMDQKQFHEKLSFT